jgi:hypothetical protein
VLSSADGPNATSDRPVTANLYPNGKMRAAYGLVRIEQRRPTSAIRLRQADGGQSTCAFSRGAGSNGRAANDTEIKLLMLLCQERVLLWLVSSKWSKSISKSSARVSCCW